MTGAHGGSCSGFYRGNLEKLIPRAFLVQISESGTQGFGLRNLGLREQLRMNLAAILYLA